jgi:hypothetical protein
VAPTLLGTVAPAPDGGSTPALREAARAVGAYPARGMTVTGGAGGVVACTEELVRLAAALRAASDALDSAAHARACLVARLGPRAGAALAPASVRGSLPMLDHDLARLAGSVRAAAAIYAHVEEDATAGMRAVAAWVGNAWGNSGPLGWVLGLGVLATGFGQVVVLRAQRWMPTPVGLAAGLLSTTSVARRHDPVGALGRLLSGPGLLPRVPAPDRHAGEALALGGAAFVRAALPGQQVPFDPTPRPGARVLVGLVSPFLAPTTLAVRPVGLRVDPPPRGEADLLELVDDTYPEASGVPGEVAVQRLDHADGSRSWVVAVPGTQEWNVGGDNPADLWSDLEATAGVPDDAAATAVRAMDLAGIRPDEPVLLVGHSLGGMVAASVAADRTVQRDFRIAAVLTAGSPVAGTALPPGTQALHLEHAQDLVPGLAGLPNPDTVSRTTVVRDLRAAAPADAVISTVDAHDLVAYEETARLLPADDPSVRGFRRASASVIGDDVVAATTWRFQGVRETAPGFNASCVPPAPAP